MTSTLMSVNHQIAMTSREIAELVGSRHDKVKQSIERLTNRKDADGNPAPVIDLPPMGEYLDTLGRPAAHYVFTGEKGKRDSYVVVAQLSPGFTAKLVDRWQELEARQAPPIPQTYAAALLEAGRLAQLAERQAEQLELAAPKVAFVDKYVTADSGSKGFRQVAKLLNANEKDFRAFLSDSKIMYKLGGEWMPYQCHADAGRFEVKGGVAGNDHVYNSALFTPKGINWIAGLWAQHCLKGSDTECRSSL